MFADMSIKGIEMHVTAVTSPRTWTFLGSAVVARFVKPQKILGLTNVKGPNCQNLAPNEFKGVLIVQCGLAKKVGGA